MKNPSASGRAGRARGAKARRAAADNLAAAGTGKSQRHLDVNDV
jgi:hypothetical protein